jgi:thioredoxin-related protein
MCKSILVLSIIFSGLLAISSSLAKDEVLGAYLGAKTATHPAWFKESFLNLEDDIADSTAQGKRLAVYFWQPGCPYCAQLWDDNFGQQDTVDMFRKHFDIVAINLWGSREVVSVGGNDYSEKSFAEALSVTYTPTLLFFNEKNKVILKLQGYVPPKDFRLALQYVSQHKDKEGSYAL